MKLKLRKLIFLFIFVLIFYAIYFFMMNKSFIRLDELNYEPINYRNFGQMNRLRKENDNQNRMKSEKLILDKMKYGDTMYKEIDCIINGDYNINCLRSMINQKVFLPFTFIRDYFDVYGDLGKNDVFYFEHSYSKVYQPTEKYDYRKKYLWFENYEVEKRPRVLRIDGRFNIPVSSQWNQNGHFYPIQICQYGLNHFNKYILNGESKFMYIDVDKFKKSDESKKDVNNESLKINETDFKEIESKTVESNSINNQISIDQLTNDDLNQTSNDEMNRKLFRREIVKLNDEIDKPSINQIDDQLNNPSRLDDNQSKHRLIYLNQTSLILTLNLTRGSSFYNSLFLSFQFKCIKNFKITAVLINEKRTKFKINYRTTNYDVFRNDNLIYGIGNSTLSWRTFGRDLGIDLIKSINLFKKKKSNNLKIKTLHLYRIIFNGQAILKNIRLSSDGHFYKFSNAVNWLLMKQDETGGWSSEVNKRLVSESLILNNFWYSSMAQGHAISLLIRIFHLRNEFNLIDKPSHRVENKNTNLKTNRSNRLINDELLRMRLKNRLNQQIVMTSDQNDDYEYFIDEKSILNNSLIYLNAAISAAMLFHKNVSDNGIKTYFMNKYVFYEEFPTTPSLFVLNGFIFSLFGLYDLKMTIDLLIKNQKLEQSLNDHYANKYDEIDTLFNDGVNSLINLLPLYDTGSSSLYDLRHFTLKTNVPPNVSRWSYHSTHINLLLHLNTLLNDQNINNCTQRWINYMRGKKSKHN